MDSDFINQNVEDLFSKTFCLDDSNSYQITDSNLYCSERWKVTELQKSKAELNEVKGRLNNYNLLKWHNHTKMMNLAGDIIKTLKKYRPELLTQAWCKFYEILNVFQLIPEFAKVNGSFNSFHLCEAPGAFITSLNHFLKIKHGNLKWNWMACTLNPYFEGNELIYMIRDDRFIVNTIENWCFGTDFTGDIKVKENFSELLHKAEIIKPIHLVTADGSIDCHINPAEQEASVLSLHYCETVAALSILEKGGNFILKMFTTFECQTICLLYILRCSFKSIHFIKPVCSKEGNSEVYVVCLDFIGKNNIIPIINILIENYENLAGPKIIFSKEDIPKTFINVIIECAKFFKYRQISAIERNIRSYENTMRKKRMILKRIRSSVVNRYIHQYNVTALTPEQFVVQNYHAYKDPYYKYTFCTKDEDYTFADKVLAPTDNQETILKQLKTKLENIQVEWFSTNICWFQELHNQDEDPETFISMKIGKIIETINSSVFCMRALIEVRNFIENEILPKNNCATISVIFQEYNWEHLEDYKFKRKHIVDFKESKTIWLKGYNDKKLSMLRKILEVLKNMNCGDSLLLNHFPLLTQFNVGLIYILGKMFEDIGFLNPLIYGYAIIFHNLKRIDITVNLKQIEDTLTRLHATDRTLVTLVSIKGLYREIFFKYITVMNHAVIKLSTLNLIESLLKTEEEITKSVTL